MSRHQTYFVIDILHWQNLTKWEKLGEVVPWNVKSHGKETQALEIREKIEAYAFKSFITNVIIISSQCYEKKIKTKIKGYNRERKNKYG